MDKKILIIDDHEQIRTAVAYLLENANKDYKVFKAGNADEGLNLLEENPDIQVIILDIIMPVKNGVQTLVELRGKSENLRIILLTGYPGKISAEKAKELGVFRYLTKPPEEEPLIFAIEDAFIDLKSKGLLKPTIKENIKDGIIVNDRWIIGQLNKGIDFSNLGVKEIKPLSDRIWEDIYDFENDPFSIWLSKRSYEEIFEKRIFPIFKFGDLDFAAELLESFIQLERLTYITPYLSDFKRSRDHFLHQFRIAILGDFLLNCYIGGSKNSQKLIEIIRHILDGHGRHYKNHTIKQIRTTWWITALLHDCCYPLYHVFCPTLFQESCYDDLNKIYSNVLTKDFKDSIEKTSIDFKTKFEKNLSDMISVLKLEEFRDQIISCFHSKFSHNIFSAFNIWDKFKDRNIKSFLPKVAAESIILHHNFQSQENIQDEKRICFVNYPLAFLLIILDEIQEWGRPIVVEDDKNPTKISKLVELDKVIMQGIYKTKTGKNYIKNKLSFILDYESREEFIKKTNLNANQKFKEKKNNLDRLYIATSDIPPIEIQMKFSILKPEPILIK